MVMVEHGLVRLLNSRGSPVGIGFVIDTNHVISCAHVVAAVLGEAAHPERITSAPPDPIWLDFPLADSAVRKARLTACVVRWLPYQPGKAGDIAILTLIDTPTHPVVALPMQVKADLWQHPFRAYGVPAGYDSGVWVTGEIRSRQAVGYFQVQTTGNGGYTIAAGFSGGPVWSDQLSAVIGMLTEADSAPGVRAAFAIPARMLIEQAEAAPSASAGQMPQPSQADVVDRFGLLVTRAAPTLETLAQRTYHAASQPSADSEDLLAGGLIQIFTRHYDSGAVLLTRLIHQQPDHAYARYGLVVAGLRGLRPAALRDFAKVRSLAEQLSQALASKPDLIAARVLLCFMKVDFFQRNGFSSLATDLLTHVAAARAEVPDLRTASELEALAVLIPDIATFALWQELRDGR